jgi:hypothetical protein
MTEVKHCKHCMGDCGGTCLLAGAGAGAGASASAGASAGAGVPGRCIHGWNDRPPRQFRPRLLLTRQWWHRVFWGVR